MAPSRAQKPMDWDAEEPRWSHLPGELLRHIAHMPSQSADELAGAEVLLRLVCRAWRAALPPGEPSLLGLSRPPAF